MPRGVRTRAFTLIELLVVIAIIAILSAMLTGPITHARARAQEVTCQNNLRQMSIMLMGYLHDYDYFPPAFSLGDSYFGNQGPLLAAFEESLRGASNILFCPRSVRLEELDISAELAMGKIGYFYWAWVDGGSNGVSRLGLGGTSNVWLTQSWNSQLGQLVLMTDHFRDKEYWLSINEDWQYHAPPDVEHSLSVPGTLAVMQDGSVRKVAPRP